MFMFYTKIILKIKKDSPYHPSFGCPEWDRSIAVHRWFQKLCCPDVPEENESDAGADRQDVALERDRPDSAAVVSGGNLFDGL
jgi:hypothetical protein